MKLNVHHDLNPELIQEIAGLFPSKIYRAHSTLFYEGQIPISGYLIIDGAIQISRKKKYKKILTSGALLGVLELIDKRPSLISAEVFPNTEICFLDKSTVEEVCQKKNTNLAVFLKGLMEKRT